MEFTVSKADLVRELNLSQGVVEKKTTIPILSNILLEAKGGRVFLTATDLELGIRCSCPAKVKKEGAGTVPAKRLLDYVRLLPDTDLTIKFLENHWASITCGRSRTKMMAFGASALPISPATPARSSLSSAASACIPGFNTAKQTTASPLISSGMRVGVLHSTRLAMRSGCAAASSNPMIPPEDSPTQWTRDSDSPSRLHMRIAAGSHSASAGKAMSSATRTKSATRKPSVPP